MSACTKSQDEHVPNNGPGAASLSDKPAAGQTVQHNGKTYKTVQEGRAYILIPPDAPLRTDPKAAKDGTRQSSSVFYNPIQQYNRDLSVLAIRAFGDEYVPNKQKELERKALQRDRKQSEKASRIKRPKDGLAESAESAECSDRATKRRKLETDRADGGDDATTVPQLNFENDEAIDADGLPDDDLLACESSMPHKTTNRNDTETNTHGAAAVDQEATTGKGPVVRFEVLDALSATGLRALRYAQELPFVTSATANDLSSRAAESIKLNIAHNKAEEKVRTTVGNANAHMYQSIGQEGRRGPGHQYQVIDLDPYGTAVPFLDAAVQAVADGGLLCVTCTDTAVFNSTGYLEKTFSLYGGLPIKGDHYAEGGLRLILHAIATAAAKYGLAIEPLLSLSVDYYARLFVRVRKSPAEVKFLAGKTMVVYSCDAGCGSWELQFLAKHKKQEGKKATTFKHSFAQAPTSSPNCSHCGFKTHLSGPMYGGPLHNPAFIERILEYLPKLDRETYPTVNRIEGMLKTALEETDLYAENSTPGKDEIARADPSAIDQHPFYFIPSSLARVLHCVAPSDVQMRGALRHGSFRATRSHAKPGTIKTDAPRSFVWKVMAEWVRQHSPIREGSLKDGMAGWQILTRLGYMGKAAETENNAIEVQKAGNSEGGESSHSAGKEETKLPAQSQVVFDEQLGQDKESRRLVRYQINPHANWGPMNRAK